MRHVLWHTLFLALAGIGSAYAQASLDTSFSSDGKQTIPFDLDSLKADELLGLHPAQGGGYWLCGRATTPGGNGLALVIAKLTATGALDTGFSIDGKHSIDTLFDSVDACAVDSQDRLLFAGTTAAQSGGGTQVILARVLPNGNPDTGFGFIGLYGFSSAYANQVLAVTTVPGDHPMVLSLDRPNGSMTRTATLYGVRGDGAADARATIGTYIGIQPTGALAWSAGRQRLISATGGFGGGSNRVLVRTIQIDTAGGGLSLSPSALALESIPGNTQDSELQVTAVAAVPGSSSLYVAGYVQQLSNPASGNHQGWVMRIGANDLRDTSFDGDGFSIGFAPFPSSDLRYAALAAAADGVYIGASVGNSDGSGRSFAVQRLQQNGALDANLTTTGDFAVETFPASGGSIASSTASAILVAGGRILVGGSRRWALPVDLDFAVLAWTSPGDLFRDGFE